MTQVVLQNIQKTYDKTTVIRDFNLSIADREFVVLVGPSGCGKTTVLRMIAGLEDISGGTIRIGDRVVNDVAPKDRDIAMVFQSYALYPHMSVYDNIAFGLKMRKTPKSEIQTRVASAADILNLSQLLDRKPKQLSGGQRQRVALGRAIVRNPQVFLMDEPLSNLDAKLRVQMRAEIQKLHRSLNATTIYVTHDQTEAMTMGDRIVILNEGIVQQVGDPPTVYTRPANMFVGSFIGSMYFLPFQYSQGVLTATSGESWPVPDVIAQQLGGTARAVTVGIRPEHFTIESQGEHLHPVTIQPELIELLGNEQLLHFTLNGQAVVASLPPDVPIRENQPQTLGLSLLKPSYFDTATGQNLLHPSSQS